MRITSYGFLFGLLPLFYLVYWYVVKSARARTIVLLFLSFSFYLLAGGGWLLLLVLVSFLTFYASRTRWLNLGIILNLLPLLLFKFAISLGTGTAAEILGFDLILPLGISYFTFKHIGYLIDVKQKRIAPAESLINFLCFSAFFAQLVAGPISSYAETGPELAQEKTLLTRKALFQAATFIVFGLSKKLLLADVLANTLTADIARIQSASILWSWGMLLAYTFQIYFDFTGYTDLVLGIALLFGIQLPENFNNPLGSSSPREFWARWHISLSFWFRYYVYFPLSRSLFRRWGKENAHWAEYLSLLLTMFLIGVWHDFTAGFVIWGLYNGLLLSIQSWGSRYRIGIEPPLLKQTFFLVSILFGFSFLVYPDLHSILAFQSGLVGFQGWGEFSVDPVTLASFLISGALILVGSTEAANFDWPKSRLSGLLLAILAVLCVLHLGNDVFVFAYARF